MSLICEVEDKDRTKTQFEDRIKIRGLSHVLLGRIITARIVGQDHESGDLGAMLPTSQTLLTRSLFPHTLNLGIELSHLENF